MDISLSNLDKKYNLKEDLVKLEIELKKLKPKTILLQLPDGLKPYATEITNRVQELSVKTIQKEVIIKIWLGSCFGACDIPNSKADLLVQFGHAPWS